MSRPSTSSFAISGARRLSNCLSSSPGLAPLARGSTQKGRLLRPFCSVFRSPLLAVFYALRVEHAAQDVIAHAGQILDAAAADHHHRMFLQVMALARDVADHLEAVGQPHLGDL